MMDEPEADFWCKDGPMSAGWMVGATINGNYTHCRHGTYPSKLTLTHLVIRLPTNLGFLRQLHGLDAIYTIPVGLSFSTAYAAPPLVSTTTLLVSIRFTLVSFR
jgi:hypothetical protein